MKTGRLTDMLPSKARAGEAISKLKNVLITGFLVVAPLGITFWVLTLILRLADSVIRLLPEGARPETWLGFGIPGQGLVLSIVVVAGVGYAMRYYTGRRVVEIYEHLLGRVPILSSVYQGVKQLVQTLSSARSQHFRQVVLVEYPRRGLYCLAFLTNTSTFLDDESQVTTSDMVSIFLPTTPNPTSGFFLMVAREDLHLVNITVEEAFKVIMSAGIVVPEGVDVAGALPEVQAETS